jgi:hypothetical protein
MTAICPGTDCVHNGKGKCKLKDKADHAWGTKYGAPGLIICDSFEPRNGPVNVSSNGIEEEKPVGT